MINKSQFTALIINLGIFPILLQAKSFGGIDQNNIQDSAVVCMSIGLQASVSGLDDISLQAAGLDGAAGAVYQNSDEFTLESNGGVTLMVASQPLFHDGYEINTHYFIDGQLHSFSTQEGEVHNSDHVFTALAQLGNISSQLAGSYSTTVHLTVVPNLGNDGGCGQQVVTQPLENSNWAFIAYEDLYPSPGDADYNDFVMAFQSAESYNANGELETINMSFIPVARGAGYNHSAHLDLNGELWNSKNVSTITDEMFSGDATIKATYTNLENGTEIEKFYSKDKKDLTIFYNTRASLNGFANVYEGGNITTPLWKTDVEITLAKPEDNLYSDRGPIGDDSYRVYLHVNNTNNDIDLYTVNPNDGMIDNNGYPFGMIIPDSWQWPLERVHIDDAYPYFEGYRSWLSGESSELSYEAEHWYLSPTTNGNVIDPNTVETILNYDNP
ncbi:MAG: LruC domain-containing protein [Gammaproteobacteria bacterium]|nr:LruC domain-containing protein [Gammaproteobacteria bacterium]